MVPVLPECLSATGAVPESHRRAAEPTLGRGLGLAIQITANLLARVALVGVSAFESWLQAVVIEWVRAVDWLKRFLLTCTLVMNVVPALSFSPPRRNQPRRARRAHHGFGPGVLPGRGHADRANTLYPGMAGHHPPVTLETHPRTTRTRHRDRGSHPLRATDTNTRKGRKFQLDELLTGEQVAACLKATPRFVRRLVSERRIAYSRLAGLCASKRRP
jgi:hypothetical protein